MENNGTTWILGALLAGFVAALVLVVGHYMIRHLRRGRRVHVLWLYVYGTTTVNGCYSAWLLLVRPALLPALAGLWIVTVLAGGADMLSHLLDRLIPWPQSDQAELEARRAQER